MRTLMPIMLTLAATVGVAHGDDIVMKGSVRLATEATAVRLGDIARLTGPDAEALADVVVAERDDASDVLEIDVRDVRQRLDAAGAHWGRVHLNGRRTIVRPRRVIAAPAQVVAPDLPRAEPTREVEATAADLVDDHTLQGAVAHFMAERLQIDPANLRLSYPRSDAALLGADLAEQRFEIQPMTSLHSDRVELRVRLWKGDHVERTEIVRLRPSIQCAVSRMINDVPRNGELTRSDVETVKTWLAPSAAKRVAPAGHIVGRIAVARLRVGETVRTNDLRLDFVISKGDVVEVRRAVGAHVIRLKAEALSDAAIGETIEFRRLGRRNRRDQQTFSARADGPGSAVFTN
jgi:flagella basal body P-ring formation protein FlgA